MTWINLPQAPVTAGEAGHLNDHNNIASALSALWTAGLQGVVNVTAPPYGAKVDGVTDDTVAIQNALNAAGAGGIVWLPPGVAVVSGPLTIPPQVSLVGAHSSHLDATSGSVIKPSSGFAGAAVVMVVDQATGGYSVASNQQSVRSLTIDGSNLSGSTIDGILVQGFVHGLILEDLQIRSMPNHGINASSNGSGFAYSWRGTRLVVQASGGYGYAVGGQTDSTWIDCEALGCQKSGFLLAAQASNTKFIGCRSEYSNFNGWEISGTWTGASAAGGPTLIDCSTDGNNRNGILVTATGDSPLSIIGGSFRRDGANGTSGGGNYAAIQCTGSTIPVKIVSPMVFPGVAQTGGANSPQIGFAVNGSSANVSVDGGVLHAATTAWSDDGTNSNIGRGANVLERVGTEASYTSTYTGLQVSRGGLDVVGEALGMPTPRDTGLVAWSHDPAFTSQASGDTMTSGVIYMAAVYVARTQAVTKIYWGIGTAAGTPTSGQNFIMLISSAGTVLASVSIDSNVATTSGQTSTITSTTLTPGWYWVGILQNATTPAKLYRASNVNGTVVNLGPNTAATKRFATAGSGLTAVPASITPSSNSTSMLAITVGVG